MVEQMKPGSVVVDLAAESGGNVEGSVAGKVVRIGHAQVWGGDNVPAQMPGPASKLYAQNLVNLLTLMTHEGEFAPDFDDEVVAGAAVTHAGRIVHEPTREAIEGPTEDEAQDQARIRPIRPIGPRPSNPNRTSPNPNDAGDPAARPALRPGGADSERRRRLADDLRPQRLRGHRGDLQGLLDPAHPADVRRQRHPRDHPARRDHRDRHDRQRRRPSRSASSRSCWPR